MSALLQVGELAVAYRPDAPVLAGVSFELATGECLAVLGESGSGKSTLARVLIGLLPKSTQVSGRVEFDGADLCATSVQAQLRGRCIAMVFQDAAASLHPLRRIGVQLAEALRRAAGDGTVADALREVGLDGGPDFARRYPHQLSGGQRQRVMIALALAARPQLLIADEITSALDPLAAGEILDLLAQLRVRRGLALLFISHDLQAVRRIADRVLLLRAGRVDACAPASEFFDAPPSDYARSLLAHAQAGPAPAARRAPAIVQVQGLAADHGGRAALRDISFELPRGSALGVIGASGSGKSTLARVLLALHRGQAQHIDIAGADPFVVRAGARKAWRRRVQIVFQDPGSALDPRMTVAETLREPLLLHRRGAPETHAAQIEALLMAVQLDPALATRRPHELSGGQQQRVAIARALALDPEVLVCDEAVSALDVSVQSDILALLRKLQQERSLSLIFISHDLGAVRSLCDRLLVLDAGRVVEQGDTAAVLADPRHPHTRKLVATLQ